MSTDRAQLDRIELTLKALVAHKDELRALAQRATDLGMPRARLVRGRTGPKRRKKPSR